MSELDRIYGVLTNSRPASPGCDLVQAKPLAENFESKRKNRNLRNIPVVQGQTDQGSGLGSPVKKNRVKNCGLGWRLKVGLDRDRERLVPKEDVVT